MMNPIPPRTRDSAIEAKLDKLVRLPWTIEIEREPTDGSLIGRVLEMRDAIATGETEEELRRELADSIRASLACRLHFGDPIPIPTGKG
jgi:predicted RNase H-like HicB family nuclease